MEDIRTKMDQFNKFTSLIVNSSDNTLGNINKIANLNDNESLTKEQASLWISKLRKGLSKKEKLDFQKWAKQSDSHRNSIFSLASFCNNSNVLHELNNLFPLDKPLPQKSNLKAKYIIAACIMFILLFAGNFFSNITPFPVTNNEQQFVEVRTLQTKIGQQTRFSLSDGSRIKLNTNSLVQVTFSKNYRLLTLIRGEANFDVTKDKSRPFTVIAGENSFTALGTIFNIQKRTDKDMELVVTEGRVLITISNEPINKITNSLTNLPEEELPGLLIASGEIATIDKNTKASKQKISFEQIQRALAWQQGRLVFNGESLNEVLAEVGRYTTKKFELADTELSKINVSGYFKANDIDGLLKSLNSNFNIQSRKTNNTTIRLSLNDEK